jgi:uncharacterized protein (DUF58 family)
MAFAPIRRDAPRSGTENGRVRQRAEQLAAALPPLMVEAERVAATVAQGVHGRRRSGTGESFWQFRQYQQGDDAAHIDWRQSARSTRSYSRENEWEAAQSVWLWCDASASMAYRSAHAPCSKFDRTVVLSLALASLLLSGEERVGLLGHDRLARAGRSAFDRVAANLLLEWDSAAGSEGLPPVLDLPRHARLVFVGDMLAPVGEIETVIRAYGARGVRGHILQIMDPAEEDLPFSGRAQFLDPENPGTLTVGRVESLRDDYHARLHSRHETLLAMARTAGWTFASHRTDRPPQTALLSLFTALSGGLP